MEFDFPPIIGIAGYAHSGKDTAADYLVSEYGYVKVSWADKLRAAVAALNPIIGFEHIEGTGPVSVRYNDLLEREGYMGAKLHPWFGEEFRGTLIRMGTEVGRDVFGADFWVDLLLGSLDRSKRYVIPDTRFPNEAVAVLSDGGDVWRIQRPGVGPVVDHPSETALSDFPYDRVIQNNGSIDDLARSLDRALIADRLKVGHD